MDINAKKGLRKPILIDEFQNKKRAKKFKIKSENFQKERKLNKGARGEKLNTYC